MPRCADLPLRCSLLQFLPLPNPASATLFLRKLSSTPVLVVSLSRPKRSIAQPFVKGGAPACLIFSTATFGRSDRYFTLLPFASFIHYDQGKYTDKGLTPEEAKALSARRVPPIASNHESAIALHRDLSVMPTVSNAEYPINHFTEYSVRPGSLAAFLKAIHDYALPAARKAGLLEFEVFTTSVGESPDRVLIATRLKNFAQLDQPDSIESQMSSHEREVWSDAIGKLVEHRDTWIMRYRADLSSDPRSAAPR